MRTEKLRRSSAAQPWCLCDILNLRAKQAPFRVENTMAIYVIVIPNLQGKFRGSGSVSKYSFVALKDNADKAKTAESFTANLILDLHFQVNVLCMMFYL